MAKEFTTSPNSADIQREQVTKTAEGLYAFSDDAAVQLVVDDVTRCDTYMEQEQWAGDWLDADVLLQSPRSGNAGTGSAMSRVPRFTLSTVLSTIVPKVTSALFYDIPYFQLNPGPGTPAEITTSKKWIMSAQLREMKFQEQVERGFEQGGLLGTAIFMWGWLDETKRVPKFTREREPETLKRTFSSTRVHTSESDKYKKTWITKEVHRPFLKQIDIRHCLVDTGLQYGDIREAKQVTLRDYNNFYDLNKLRGQEGYDIPVENELLPFFFPPKRDPADPPNQTETLPANLRSWIQHATPRNMDSTADPLQHTIVRYQRWDNEKVIEILRCNGRSLLIRNEANPFGKIPFYSFNWRNIPSCFYGQGLGKLIGMDQRVEESLLNAALAIISYQVKPSYVRKRGKNAPTQQIRQSLGGIIDVEDDVDKAFRIMELPKVDPAVWQMASMASASAQETSGANQQVGLGAGASGVKTTGMRSGTGAAAVVQANASRLDGPMERFIRQVFIPWLYQMDELNNDRLPSSTIREILGEEVSQEFANDIDHIDFRNAVLDYDVLAGAHLGATAKELQAIPFYMQAMNSPALMQKMTDEGYEIDGVALIKKFADLTGTANSGIIKRMTPQKQQQVQANSPAAIQAMKAKAASDAQDKQFEQKQQLQEENQMGRAAGEQTRTLMEHAFAQEIPPDAGLQSE